MPWQPCGGFSEAMAGGIAGGASRRNRVRRPSCISIHRPTGATQKRHLGTNMFHWEQYWRGFVSYSIAMAKLFSNSINRPTLEVVHLIQRLSSTVNSYRGLGLQFFHFPGSRPNHVLARFNPYFHATYLCVGKYRIVINKGMVHLHIKVVVLIRLVPDSHFCYSFLGNTPQF